ncbi:hypothetical protein QZM93_38510 [Burkholderia cepacia]|uniref:hypothetical protein n=1 Tax=Burkholderia cepacia TaxID=292 RepID=UPI0011AD553E|nr:hypothetical protein [Burkholderia cepacia]MDN7894456.1 hypothetical protein [Burkholderia cepacia]MDN7894496.1 hypothetical protein [Burkholderia cepacia]
MDELNAAPSSTETADPMTDAEREALPDWVKNGQPPVQEAGTATSGEQSSASGDTSASAENDTVDAPTTDAPAVGGGVDAPSHLLMLDAMLAEIERKIAAGIHLFAHEVTAARDHLAKLL